MIYLDVTKGLNHIGRLGENEHRTLRFRESAEILTLYPEAVVTVLHKRPGDLAAYPVAAEYVDVSSGMVCWTIQSGDLARVGRGKVELVFAEGDVIAKSFIYDTFVDPALNGSEEPPDPWRTWIDGIEKGMAEQIAQLQQQVTLLTEQVSIGMDIPRFESGELIRIEGIITDPEIAYGLNITTGTGEGYWPKAGDLFVLKTTADIYSVQDGQYYLCFDVPRSIEDEEGLEIESWDDSYIIRNIKASGITSGVKLFEKDKIYIFRCYTSSSSGGLVEVLNYIDPQAT